MVSKKTKHNTKELMGSIVSLLILLAVVGVLISISLKIVLWMGSVGETIAGDIKTSEWSSYSERQTKACVDNGGFEYYGQCKFPPK